MRPLVALLIGLAPAIASATPADPDLHRPSPDWRDQVIYFAMIDRFDDGDPANNDQGAGEYDPSDRRRYSGGDLAGLTRRIDYLRALGATALWITPPVANQWWDPRVGYSGYHGYWASDFASVDAHYGTLEEYRTLSRRLHAAGMYLVQDIVVNHTGNFFSWDGEFDPSDPLRGMVVNAGSLPGTAPTQPPFHLNDARDPAQREAAIYHWTPAIRDYTDVQQERTWALADLDDLDTTRSAVRTALRQSYAHWIREVGVDAFRVDTAFYVEPEFFRDFLHAEEPGAPGILRVAAGTGRENFHVFGEGFAVDPPFEEAGARKIERWARDAQGDLLPGMINFPLYGSLQDVFARGRPAAVLRHRIESMMRVHARPHLMPTFVDNHDVDRFLAAGSAAGLKQALLLILTLPGIPVIYYGTEQGLVTPRETMFAQGYGAGGRDRFDPDSSMFRWLQQAIALRHAEPALRRGVPRVLAAEEAGAGALVFVMQAGDERLLIAFNSADHDSLAARIDTALAPGTRALHRYAIQGEAPALTVDRAGRLDLVLPPRAGYVWRLHANADTPKAATRVTLDPLPIEPIDATRPISGYAPPGETVALVIDGDLASARRVTSDAQGRWRSVLDPDLVDDAGRPHRIVAWAERSRTASAAREFRIARRWEVLAEVEDPPGDDVGPTGHYRYPSDPVYAAHRPLDLRRVRVLGAGRALRLELTLADLVATWNPPLGFDHLALAIYLELPGRDGGAREMPGQFGQLPDDMRWHLRVRLGGWAVAAHAAAGASATLEGAGLAPAPALQVDAARDTLMLELAPRLLGEATALRGARLYVTTWDWDGGWRGLAPQPGAFVFGGGAADAARIMDDSGVITLR